MKKLLVLVVTVLAFAGLTALAYADTVIFSDAWSVPLSGWQGANQTQYAVDSTKHALTDEVVLSPFPGEATNFVAKITYNKSKESWAGRIAISDFGTKLSGVSKIKFEIRAEPLSLPLKLNKAVSGDSNGNYLTIVPNANVSDLSFSSTTWKSFESVLNESTGVGIFSGRNMSLVKQPVFGFYMTGSENPPATTGSVIFYLDNVMFVGGGSGTVIVTLTSGVVGVQIEQSVDFDLVSGGVTTNNNYNSAEDISNLAKNHFIVTSKCKSGSTNSCHYLLNLDNPGGWTNFVPTGPGTGNFAPFVSLKTDEYALWALFNDQPASQLPTDDYYLQTDILGTTPVAATASTFGFTGAAATGMSVVDGDDRSLWIALRTPSYTSVGSTQQIAVVVTAMIP